MTDDLERNDLGRGGSTMDDVIAFLRARLDEWEAAANAMKAVYPTPWDVSDRGWMARVVADAPSFLEVVRLENDQALDARWLGDVIQHVALNNPDFVLADVAAKRKIIAEHGPGNLVDSSNGRYFVEPENWDPPWRRCIGHEHVEYPCSTLRLLALPYAGHPQYREEWKP